MRSAKPRRDPMTGCAHLINYDHPGFGYRRCCSYCYRAQPKTKPEAEITECWYCWTPFDHADDEEREADDHYD